VPGGGKLTPIEIELALYGSDAEYYRVELKCDFFDEQDNQVDAPINALFRFPKEELDNSPTNDEYGTILTNAVFSDTTLRLQYLMATANARLRSLPVRFRLRIDRTARQLTSINWELLKDPTTGQYLSTNQNVYFSRFLARSDYSAIKLRRHTKMTALVVAANPSNLGTGPYMYPLASIDVNEEVQLAKDNLPGIEVQTLPENHNPTLDNIISALGGDYDILYLICHGLSAKGETWLLLEDDSGKAKPVRGSHFVERLGELQQRPRLIVLASCQSANPSAQLAALGPRLAESGVPAVLAMQGNVSISTAKKFMPVFFTQLVRDGQIDRAASFARNSVSDRNDFSFPVLFMRLYNGKIWYEPRFSQEDRQLKKWNALLTSVFQGACTPVLGSGLLDPYIGSTRDVARNLALLYGYPLSESALDALPQICQYLSTTQSPSTMQFDLRLECSRQIIRRFCGSIPALLGNASLSARLSDPTLETELEQLLKDAWLWRRSKEEAEPIQVLAQLPFRRYLKVFPDSLLEYAISEVRYGPNTNKIPSSVVYDWRRTSVAKISSALPGPSIERPVISYLFGRFDKPESLVWSEDNYFEYLINVTKQDPRNRSDLTSTLTNSALLFLGFRLEEWDFRVLHRSILALGGSERNRQYAHVAVQIDPGDSNSGRGPSQMREYLESYFNSVNVSIYWGGVEDFARDLWERYVQFDPRMTLRPAV
jgi:hypothetical protein